MEFQDKNNANIAVKQSFMITTSSEQFQKSNCKNCRNRTDVCT